MTAPDITSTSRVKMGVGALVLAALMSILFGWICDRTFGHETWTKFILENFGLVFGLPMAAALAFGIVVAFQQTADGPLSMRMGPLEFSGPAGPILLWVVCFLAAVFAIALLSD